MYIHRSYSKSSECALDQKWTFIWIFMHFLKLLKYRISLQNSVQFLVKRLIFPFIWMNYTFTLIIEFNLSINCKWWFQELKIYRNIRHSVQTIYHSGRYIRSLSNMKQIFISKYRNLILSTFKNKVSIYLNKNTYFWYYFEIIVLEDGIPANLHWLPSDKKIVRMCFSLWK